MRLDSKCESLEVKRIKSEYSNRFRETVQTTNLWWVLGRIYI